MMPSEAATRVVAMVEAGALITVIRREAADPDRLGLRARRFADAIAMARNRAARLQSARALDRRAVRDRT